MVEGKDEAKIKRSQGPIGESDPGRLTLSGGGRGLFRVGGSQSVDWVCVLLFFGGGGDDRPAKTHRKKTRATRARGRRRPPPAGPSWRRSGRGSARGRTHHQPGGQPDSVRFAVFIRLVVVCLFVCFVRRKRTRTGKKTQ